MTDDTTNGEALTFEEMMDAAEVKIEDEMEEYDFEVPNHAGRLLMNAVSDLNATLTDIQVAEAMDDVELTDEEIAEALATDSVEVILALGALRYEYGTDIESAYEERMEVMEAVREAGSMEEMMEAVMGEEAMEAMEAIEPGDNMDRDDYNHESVERSFA